MSGLRDLRKNLVIWRGAFGSTCSITMDVDDENITTLLNMGFPDIGEIKQALRIAKNDLNEAVAVLTNDRSAPPYDPMDVQDMDIEERNATAVSVFSAANSGSEVIVFEDRSSAPFSCLINQDSYIAV